MSIADIMLLIAGLAGFMLGIMVFDALFGDDDRE